MSGSISIQQVTRTFGFATYARQTFAIAWASFATIAKGATGLVLWAPIAVLVGLLMPAIRQLGGVPLLPRTAAVLTVLTAPVAGHPQSPLVLIPLLIVFYAGEVVWRERDAGLSELARSGAIDGDEAGNGANERRFAGPRGADQGHHLAGLDAK